MALKGLKGGMVGFGFGVCLAHGDVCGPCQMRFGGKVLMSM